MQYNRSETFGLCWISSSTKHWGQISGVKEQISTAARVGFILAFNLFLCTESYGDPGVWVRGSEPSPPPLQAGQRLPWLSSWGYGLVIRQLRLRQRGGLGPPCNRRLHQMLSSRTLTQSTRGAKHGLKEAKSASGQVTKPPFLHTWTLGRRFARPRPWAMAGLCTKSLVLVAFSDSGRTAKHSDGKQTRRFLMALSSAVKRDAKLMTPGAHNPRLLRDPHARSGVGMDTVSFWRCQIMLAWEFICCLITTINPSHPPLYPVPPPFCSQPCIVPILGTRPVLLALEAFSPTLSRVTLGYHETVR